MKAGDKVKCTEHNGTYLTVGKTYTVTAGEDDIDKYGDTIVFGDVFQIFDDVGEERYCLTTACAHAKWELVL